MGHELGEHAPGHEPVIGALDVSHHVLLAHAETMEVLHNADSNRPGSCLIIYLRFPELLIPPTWRPLTSRTEAKTGGS
jgi:hypothetical protein